MWFQLKPTKFPLLVFLIFEKLILIKIKIDTKVCKIYVVAQIKFEIREKRTFFSLSVSFHKIKILFCLTLV